MADPLKVECPNCGGSLKLKDRSAEGKKVRCPKCQEPFKVELPPEEDDLDALDEVDDLDELDDLDDADGYEDEAPRRKSKGSAPKKSKKKKSRSGNSILPLMIGGIVLGASAFIGLIVVVAMNLKGSGNKIDLAYILPEHDCVMRFKAADILNAPLLSDFVNSNAYKQAMASGNVADLKPTDIDTVTVGTKVPAGGANAAMAGNSSVVVVVRTKKPFDITIDAKKGNWAELTHNGTKYYNSQIQMGGLCSYAPNSYVMVMAPEADLKRVIDQGRSDKRRPEFDFVDPNHQVMIAVNKSSPETFKIPEMAPPGAGGSSGPGAAAAAQLQKSLAENAQGFCFCFDLREGIDIQGILNCKDDGGAGTLKGQLDLVLGEAKTQANQSIDSNMMMKAGDLKEVGDLVKQTIASINVTQEKNLLNLKMAVPSNLKAVGTKLANNPLIGMMLGGMMGGGLGGGGLGAGPGAGMTPPGMTIPGPGTTTGAAMHGATPMPGTFPMPTPGSFPMPGAIPMPMPMPM